MSSWGITGTDAEERINWDRMRVERQRKANEQIKKAGLGTVVGFYEENIRYLTSARGPPWTRDKPGLRYGVMFEDGDVLLYEQGDNKYHAMRNNPWLGKKNIRHSYATWIKGAAGPASQDQARKFAKDLKNEMKAHKVVDLPLGLDFIDFNLLNAFKEEGITVADGMSPLHEARAVKTKDEIEAERVAVSIADSIHYEATKIIRPGIMENQIMAHLFDYAYSFPGLDYVETIIVSSGPNTWPNNRSFTDRIVGFGDLLFIDVVIAWNGYHTCYYRTYSVGKKPTQEQKDYYKLALDWLYSAIKTVRPGVTTKDIALKFPSAQQTWGYVDEEEAAANLWGHGQGLSHYDLPMITRISSLAHPYPIKEGMVFALETQHGKMFQWGVRIEEMLVVTDSGYEVLTKFPVEEITPVL
jgi:Xaa-Pro dipeptidase